MRVIMRVAMVVSVAVVMAMVMPTAAVVLVAVAVILLGVAVIVGMRVLVFRRDLRPERGQVLLEEAKLWRVEQVGLLLKQTNKLLEGCDLLPVYNTRLEGWVLRLPILAHSRRRVRGERPLLGQRHVF